MSEIIVPEKVELMESDVLNPVISIEDRLNLAGDVATKFKQAIVQLGLIHKIKGHDYVTVSGWSTLGTMIGIHVENIRVEPFPVTEGFAYHAKVDLVDKNGIKIGEGDGICTNQGYQKEVHAVYSMAITRATGKAYRLCLAWLVEMAGYNATPYEEMPEDIINHHNEKPANKIRKEFDELKPDDNLKVICQEIKYRLEEQGKPVTKSNMRTCVVKLIKAGKLEKKQRPALIQFIDKHCPEALK